MIYDTGYRIYRIQDTVSRIQDTGYAGYRLYRIYRIQDTGYRIQYLGYRIQDIQDTGYRIQYPHRTQPIGEIQ